MGLALDGRRVLLTGASGGIGRAIARVLHARGALLLLTARRTEALQALQRELGSRSDSFPADLAQREAVSSLVERVGDVDGLVANAALPASGELEDFSYEEIDRALDVNLRAPVQLARRLVPGMVERGTGHLVFISSLSGKVASPRTALYSATKFGVRGFALGLRQDLDGTGVGVTTVFPTFVAEAGLFAETGVELPRGMSTVTPDQVAGAVLRGIERDRAEIDVAPLGLRAGALAGSAVPALAAGVQRRFGGRDLAARIARAQSAKR
jgi:uncharacterized protein